MVWYCTYELYNAEGLIFKTRGFYFLGETVHPKNYYSKSAEAAIRDIEKDENYNRVDFRFVDYPEPMTQYLQIELIPDANLPQ